MWKEQMCEVVEVGRMSDGLMVIIVVKENVLSLFFGVHCKVEEVWKKKNLFIKNLKISVVCIM